MNFSHNYFEIFDLPIVFEIDKQLLKERYLVLQRQFHPDRYAGQSAQQQRLAVQSAAAVNQAYEALLSPVKRGQYLLEMAGIEPDNGNKTTSDTGFLMTQMNLREQLADINQAGEPFAQLDMLEQQVRADADALEQAFADEYDRSDLDAAGETLAKLQFYGKLLREIEELEAHLEESL